MYHTLKLCSLINEFVNLISEDYLLNIFNNYHCHQYDHLMSNLVKILSIDEMRICIFVYLDYFTIKNLRICERKQLLTEIVLNQDIDKFKYILQCDQYFEEPLFHIANGDFRY